MLVLTRRAEMGDQSKIRIGDDIEIVIIEVRGDQVRVGVDAPRNVSVHRKEIWLEIQEKTSAANSSQGTPRY